MEIETRNCPGCGAPVSIPKGVKIYCCEYCGSEISADDLLFEEEKEQIRLQMERDKAKAYKDRLEWENREYKKEQRRNRKRDRRNSRTISCVGCFVVLLVPLIFISVIAYKTIIDNPDIDIFEQSFFESSQAAPEVITDLDKIPKVTLDKINRTSAKKSDRNHISLYSGWYVAEKAVPFGDYLVSYDDGSGNYLISVMKTTYKNDKENLEQSVYTAYYTNDICLKDDGTTVQSHPERLTEYCKDLSGSLYLNDSNEIVMSLVSGWESLKELYADCIDSDEKKYHISYTKSMYIPGKSKSLSKTADYIPSIGVEVDEGQSEEMDYEEKTQKEE